MYCTGYNFNDNFQVFICKLRKNIRMIKNSEHLVILTLRNIFLHFWKTTICVSVKAEVKWSSYALLSKMWEIRILAITAFLLMRFFLNAHPFLLLKAFSLYKCIWTIKYNCLKGHSFVYTKTATLLAKKIININWNCFKPLPSSRKF